MMITALLESKPETRVALSPASAKQYVKLGFSVSVEKNAGLASGFSNEDYEQAGAQVFGGKKTTLKQTNILLCVNEPNPTDLEGLSENCLIIGHIDKNPESALVKWCLSQKISLISMNLIPRLSRAQSMDSLSSQANLAGYRGVLEAVHTFNKVVPMMMTAAGMIQPAKVLVLGAGVAGLQAIATAKRLGAVIYAFDVRRAAKEQVESLGAEFIEVSQEQDSETKGGYAAETSDEYKKMQANLIDEYAKQADIVISTALIPDRQAPVLLYKKTIEAMKPGSVVVDLATSRGGNCELSVTDQVTQHGGVTIIGLSNIAGLVPTTASELYSNNLLHLVRLLATNPPEINFNSEDEIIIQATLCQDGKYLPFQAAKENSHA